MGVSFDGLKEAVDRREGEVRQLEIEAVGVPTNAQAERPGQAHRNPILGPANGGESDLDAALQRLHQFSKGALIN